MQQLSTNEFRIEKVSESNVLLVGYYTEGDKIYFEPLNQSINYVHFELSENLSLEEGYKRLWDWKEGKGRKEVIYVPVIPIKKLKPCTRIVRILASKGATEAQSTNERMLDADLISADQYKTNRRYIYNSQID